MPRNLSPAVSAAIAAPQKTLALFLEIVFTNETLYLWGGVGNTSSAGPAWDPGATFPYGQVFTGVGWLGRIESVPQNSELTAENMTLQLSGIPPDLLGDVINTVRLTGTAQLWVGFFLNGVLEPDPVQLWLGATDVPTLSDGAETCAIAITVENALLSLNSSSNRRFTTLDQQLDYPGDTGFDYVSAMQDLYLPYPDGITALTTIGGSNLHDAPAVSSGLTIAPAGPQILSLSGTAYPATLQMSASAYFVSGPYINDSEPVVSAGLWSSADTGVAIVTNGYGADGVEGTGHWGTGGGLITPTGLGNCTITFFFGTVSCSITVTVLP